MLKRILFSILLFVAYGVAGAADYEQTKLARLFCVKQLTEEVL